MSELAKPVGVSVEMFEGEPVVHLNGGAESWWVWRVGSAGELDLVQHFDGAIGLVTWSDHTYAAGVWRSIRYFWG